MFGVYIAHKNFESAMEEKHMSVEKAQSWFNNTFLLLGATKNVSGCNQKFFLAPS